jgi:hypothetical protein
MTQVHPDRRLFIFPFSPYNDTEYVTLKDKIASAFNVQLPEGPRLISKPFVERDAFGGRRRWPPGSIGGFIYFDLDGTPTLITLNRKIVPYLRRTIFDPLVPYFSVALGPLLSRCGAKWNPPAISVGQICQSIIITIVCGLCALVFMDISYGLVTVGLGYMSSAP